MDQIQLQQNIAKYYAKLPVELQQFFSSMKWMEDLKNISTKYSLKEEQIKTLGTETTLVLLGIIHIEDYQENLEKELGLDKEITEKIIIEIDEKIIKNIKEKLIESFEANAKDLLEEKYGGDKKLDERFASLPQEVQIAINESDYQTTLYSIASKYKLSIEDMGMLEEITTKVMLNIVHPDQYENELISKLKISKEDISNLVKDVNEQILKTIREILKKKWDEGGTIKNEELGINNGVDNEVPKPPYAKITKNEELGTRNELPKTIEKPNPIKPIEEIKITQNTPQYSVNEIIKKIEPIKPIQEITEIPKNIIEEKLKAATASNHTVSDYSLPPVNKTVSDEARPKSSDPYREAF